MNKKITLLIIITLLIVPEILLARAGGGGGTNGGGEIFTMILAFILAPFFLIYSAIMTAIMEQKRNKVKKLTRQLEKEDKMWNYRYMTSQVEKIFFKVQEAWMKRDQNISKDLMSERIFNKHKMQTDLMVEEGRINVLSKINIKEITIFSIEDYKNDEFDTFSAFIIGSMIDYDIDEKTQNILNGSDSEIDNFKEIWTFIRRGNKWVLDEIDQNVTIGDIKKKIHIEE
jgi:predicted lipid-binding transport protein (Tim44 family)